MIPTARSIAAVMVLLGASGCSGATVGDPIALPIPDFPPSDGLLERPELQAIVDLQVERDGAGLQALLESTDEAMRARVSLALASVQDPTALDGLIRRLSDTSPRVRRNAAFALGQLALPDGGVILLESLATEDDTDVRSSLIGALGKRGGSDAIAGLLGRDPNPAEETGRTLAIAQAALREVRPAGVMEFLVDGLTHSNPELRSKSAYYFGRAASVSAWSESAGRVRAALDGYPPDEPSAMDLIQALGRLRDVPEDATRIGYWMRTATDWRTRTNAARIVMSPQWLESSDIQDALVAALEDPSEHVRIAAAGSVALLTWSSEEYLRLAEAWIRGPPEEWRVQASFTAPLAALGAGAAVVDWTRRMATVHPSATVRGIESLGGLPASDVVDLLFELAEHPEPLVRGAAVLALAQRWGRGAVGDEPAQRFYMLFVGRLGDSENLPVARAAFALSHPSLAPLGAELALEGAFRARRANGDTNVLIPILESMSESSLPLLREVVEGDDLRVRAAAARSIERLTGEQVPIGATAAVAPRRSIDWVVLAQLGATPRIRIVTDQGEMMVRLFTEQAPLSVQTFVEDVRRGAHDGTRFHRVVSNFVAQGGDLGMGDGSGIPAYQIRSEFTQLPFQRGTLGMASAGKDTEGSQFYLAHSMQPHLDGGYTAFGWIEEGANVLDLIQQGDELIRLTLED